MAESSQDKLYGTTLQTIGVVAKLPVVRVDRDAFLRRQFADSEHLQTILENGPQSVYTVESLRRKADGLIKSSAARTSAASFASGLPGNPVVMVAAGGADVAQFFGFAINLAQQIAYLGAMFGAAGAAGLITNTSKVAGEHLGKKVAAQALTHTAWYPVVKKVGAAIGVKITKATVEKTITKAVPVVGGVVSGGLTYLTFRPMGHRLADTLVKNLNGEYDDELELNQQYLVSRRPSATKSAEIGESRADADIVDGDIVEETGGPV